MKEGKERLLHPDGTVAAEMNYRQGELHGPSRIFGEGGDLLAESTYIEGGLEGEVKRYFPGGELAASLPYEGGMADGEHCYFFPDGTLKSLLEYQGGKLHGQVLLNHPDGHPKRLVTFQEGKRHGPEGMWDEHHTQLLEALFEEDELIGTSRRWYPSGQQAEEITVHGPTARHDIYQWTEEGELAVEGIYDDDGESYTLKLLQPDGTYKTRHGQWDGNQLSYRDE